jgi:pimeloyl-ACP methyl ester carboxylesterase
MTLRATLAAFADQKLLYPAVYPTRKGSQARKPSRTFAAMPELPSELFPRLDAPRFEYRAGVLRFESSAWPLVDEVRDAILRHRKNRIVTASVTGDVARRPVVLGLHGYLGGKPRSDRLSLAASRFERAGYTFVHGTLPFHGARAEEKGRPFFPHADPRISFEALRQGALDTVALVDALRELGARRIVLCGLSLGAYVASLAATITRDLDGLVLLTPLASFRDLVAAPAGDARDLLMLTRACTRAPAIPGSNVLVVGAREDRITPLPHARSLADHFKGTLTVIEGGHLLPFGRDEALDRWLAKL